MVRLGVCDCVSDCDAVTVIVVVCEGDCVPLWLPLWRWDPERVPVAVTDPVSLWLGVCDIVCEVLWLAETLWLGVRV